MKAIRLPANCLKSGSKLVLRDNELKVNMFVDKPLPSVKPTGIGVAAFNAALALSKRRNTVHFVCRGSSESTTAINNHLSVQTIRHYSRDNLRVSLEVMREEKPEIVHIHSSAALPSLLLGRALGRGIVMHSHGDEPLRPISLTLMRKIGMNFSHRVVAVSQSTRQDLIEYQHLSPEKVVVAYNGVDTEEFRPSTVNSDIISKYVFEGYDKMILSVGAVQLRKGQSMIVECLSKLLQRWPGLVYVNVGNPYDETFQNRLLKRAEVLGVSKAVKLLNGLPRSDLVALIGAADLCVHPSTREPFGLAVVEEMACGKPVVAFNVDAMPEIIDDQLDGLLIKPYSMEDLTKSILNVLEDPQFARKLGDAARLKVASKFTWDQTASRLMEIYGELLP
jgi:glycosyltransferase involved in cell wall biosynthesis